MVVGSYLLIGPFYPLLYYAIYGVYPTWEKNVYIEIVENEVLAYNIIISFKIFKISLGNLP